MKKYLLITILLGTFLFQFASAGTTGKFSGTLKDKTTNEEIIGGSVVVVGTQFGASTDIEGNYFILGIPPGIYTLKASYIGYKDVTISNLKISIDLTTKQDFALSQEDLKIEEVVIVAEQELVQKGVTATTSFLDAQQIESAPIDGVGELIGLEAGVTKSSDGAIHIRGGRTGEVAYLIDGISVTDVFDGGQSVELEAGSVQELQVITGAFNAEYGKAQSGVINSVAKAGGEKFNGGIQIFTGDYVTSHDKIWQHVGKITPQDNYSFQANIEGPILKNKLTFYSNFRYKSDDGFLYGKNTYNPWDVTAKEEAVKEGATQNLAELRTINDAGQLITFEEAGLKPDTTAAGTYYIGKSGENKFKSMNKRTDVFALGKLFWNIGQKNNLSYTGIFDSENYTSWDANYLYNIDARPTQKGYGYTHILAYNHALTQSSVLNAKFSAVNNVFDEYNYKNINDDRQMFNVLVKQGFKDNFSTGGVPNKIFGRETNSYNFKLDYENQLNNHHLVKIGGELTNHILDYDNIEITPNSSFGNPYNGFSWVSPDFTQNYWVFDTNANQVNEFLRANASFVDTIPGAETYIDDLLRRDVWRDQYNRKPREFSAFIQDKIEYDYITINAGVRMDIFDPNTKVPKRINDANLVTATSFDSSRVAQGQANLWINQKTGEILWDNRDVEYKKASKKINFSPRLGISFPISKDGYMSFSYGHFIQTPRFSDLYLNGSFRPDRDFLDGKTETMGNPDLDYEKTVSYEIALKQGIGNNLVLGLNLFYRDVVNLKATDDVKNTTDTQTYKVNTNSDYGNTKGALFSFENRFTNEINASVDYTYLVTTGRFTSDDYTYPQNSLLDWDQAHTLNFNANYEKNNFGGAGLIGSYGSGYPYEPPRKEGNSVIRKNTERKPSTFNLDLEMHKYVQFGMFNTTFFVKVFNLFDTKIVKNVFGETGEANSTEISSIDRENHNQVVNSIDEYRLRDIPTNYQPPRKIQFGVKMNF
ncbi:TonB-dependent receptor [bacterium]|nr:TonB-dependent receptor [bacterium]